MDEIKIEEGEALDEGSCNRCKPRMVDGEYVFKSVKVKLVYFYGFCVRLCDKHFQEMLEKWASVLAAHEEE